MSNPSVRVEKPETEAAVWHVRLTAPVVSTATIEEFFAWRASPENAEAYARVEQVWQTAGELRGDPAIATAMDEALSRRPAATRPSRSRVVYGLAAAGAALALTIGAWTWLHGRSVFATEVGEQRVVHLADGSSVTLDTASRIRVRFADDRRLVDLERGQALFTVADDHTRPFVVEAGGAQVTAVGTVFDVRRDGATVSVTLVSGTVDVTPAGGGRAVRRMTAGQQSLVTPAELVTAAADVKAETSWTDGRIVFSDTPLRQAVAEVNRYLTAKIELDAAALETTPVNGVFKIGDRDAFVSTAAQVFDLEASPGPEGTVRLSERKNN